MSSVLKTQRQVFHLCFWHRNGRESQLICLSAFRCLSASNLQKRKIKENLYIYIYIWNRASWTRDVLEPGEPQQSKKKTNNVKNKENWAAINQTATATGRQRQASGRGSVYSPSLDSCWLSLAGIVVFNADDWEVRQVCATSRLLLLIPVVVVAK